MNDKPEATITRKQIAIRLAYTLFYVVIYFIAKAIMVFATLFQFIYLFVTLTPHEPSRAFVNKVVTYTYRLWRYITLNANQRPFPFSEFPAEADLPEPEVKFD